LVGRISKELVDLSSGSRDSYRVGFFGEMIVGCHLFLKHCLFLDDEVIMGLDDGNIIQFDMCDSKFAISRGGQFHGLCTDVDFFIWRSRPGSKNLLFDEAVEVKCSRRPPRDNRFMKLNGMCGETLHRFFKLGKKVSLYYVYIRDSSVFDYSVYASECVRHAILEKPESCGIFKMVYDGRSTRCSDEGQCEYINPEYFSVCSEFLYDLRSALRNFSDVDGRCSFFLPCDESEDGDDQ